METIIVSTHKDFMGELDDETIELYKKYAKENLAELGYDVVFDDNLNTYNCITPFSWSSNEYRDISDDLEAAWIHAVN